MYKLFLDKKHPFVFKNALQACWLNYTTKYLIEQDLNLIDFFTKGDTAVDHHIEVIEDDEKKQKDPADKEANKKDAVDQALDFGEGDRSGDKYEDKEENKVNLDMNK